MVGKLEKCTSGEHFREEGNLWCIVRCSTETKPSWWATRISWVVTSCWRSTKLFLLDISTSYSGIIGFSHPLFSVTLYDLDKAILFLSRACFIFIPDFTQSSILQIPRADPIKSIASSLCPGKKQQSLSSHIALDPRWEIKLITGDHPPEIRSRSQFFSPWLIHLSSIEI